MRILVLNWRDIRSPRAGGAELLTHEIAKRLVARGHEVTWFTSETRGVRPDRGCRWCAARPARLRADDALARAPVRAQRRIRRHRRGDQHTAVLRAAVVTGADGRAHQPARARGLVVRSAEASRCDWLGERARLPAGVPTHTGDHDLGVDCWRLAPARAARAHRRDSDGGQHRTSERTVAEALEGHLVSIGRLTPSKRYAHAIEAPALLRRTHAGATLTIVGEGQERVALEEQAHRMRIADAVRLPGRMDEAAKTAERPKRTFSWARLPVRDGV